MESLRVITSNEWEKTWSQGWWSQQRPPSAAAESAAAKPMLDDGQRTDRYGSATFLHNNDVPVLIAVPLHKAGRQVAGMADDQRVRWLVT